jgi:hypothetical protein
MGYQIAGTEYKTKKDITLKCRDICKAAGVVSSQDNQSFLLNLLQYHHDWDSKRGEGIDEIQVLRNPEYPGQNTIYLRRVDQSVIDISWTQAVHDIPTGRFKLPQRVRDFKAAARADIKDQIQAFRESSLSGEAVCAISGERLSPDNVHVDHAPPKTFDALLYSFCSANRINPANVDVGSRGGLVPFIADHGVCEAWQDFHSTNAQLRLTTVSANLRQKRPAVMNWAGLCK